jgi:hypothetical protein
MAQRGSKPPSDTSVTPSSVNRPGSSSRAPERRSLMSQADNTATVNACVPISSKPLTRCRLVDVVAMSVFSLQLPHNGPKRLQVSPGNCHCVSISLDSRWSFRSSVFILVFILRYATFQDHRTSGGREKHCKQLFSCFQSLVDHFLSSSKRQPRKVLGRNRSSAIGWRAAQQTSYTLQSETAIVMLSSLTPPASPTKIIVTEEY